MQLRLVEGPTRVRRAPATETPSTETGSTETGSTEKVSAGRSSAGRGAPLKGRPLKGAVKGGPGKGSRRAVHWADWHLDARTRRVGRAGVAAAKAALEQAARPEPGTGTPLSKAS